MSAELFEFLLTAEAPARPSTVDAWWRANRGAAGRFASSVDVATATGFISGTTGYAFASGYQAALRALVPELGDELAAFCVTEAGGGHPRAIRTELDGTVLSGTKSFVSMGSAAETLLVVAVEGVDPEGRPRLRLARVDARQDAVSVTDRPPLPIVPEIPHGEVHLDCAEADSVLEGDGYLAFVKPFRTIEDIHVSAAILGWLCAAARTLEWPDDVLERLLATIASLRNLGECDAASPATHIALAGAMSMMNDGLALVETHWAGDETGLAAMWQRDKAILGIAQRVRSARREAAWGSYPGSVR